MLDAFLATLASHCEHDILHSGAALCFDHHKSKPAIIAKVNIGKELEFLGVGVSKNEAAAIPPETSALAEHMLC